MDTPMPDPGIQALILCGPGTSFETLLSQETPKCLALIANRPMIYYPLQFCQRSEIHGKSVRLWAFDCHSTPNH